MKYISVKEASKKWGISERRVRILCSENRIDGVTKSSWAWSIPSNADKPSDGRTLRHVKNVGLRLDSINFNALSTKQEAFNKASSSKEMYKQYFDDSVNRFLLLSLCEEDIKTEDITSLLKDPSFSGIPFNQKMLILNSKSIIVGFYKQLGFGPILPTSSKADPFISEQSLIDIYNSLFKGIDDYYVAEYREGKVENPSSYESKLYDVSLQIETLIFQYEREWKMLNGLVKASFMFSQLLRIQPFEKHNFLFASIIFSAILLENNFPLAVIPVSLKDELKANLSLTLRRANYTNLITMFESSLNREFDLLSKI